MPKKEKVPIPKPLPFHKEISPVVRNPTIEPMNIPSIDADQDDDDEDDDDDDDDDDDIGENITRIEGDDEESEEVEGSEDILASNNGDSSHQGQLNYVCMNHCLCIFGINLHTAITSELVQGFLVTNSKLVTSVFGHLEIDVLL